MGVAGAAAVAFLVLEPAPRLQAMVPGASGASAEDTDGDGLPDRLELLIGTSPDLVDSDGDGFPDAEEVARGSAPDDAFSVPLGSDPRVSVSAYLDTSGGLHPLSCVYVPGGDFSTNQLAMGVRVHDVLFYRPLSFFIASGSIKSVPAADPEDLLIALDSDFSANLVHRFGSLSFFSTLSVSGVVTSAGAVNVFSIDGEVMQLVQVQLGPMPLPGGSSTIGGVYEPLEPGGGGDNWVPNSICAQGLSAVGGSGAVVVHEVTSAECQSGWDASCSPSCPGTLGSTVRTVDPGALIGG